ncbi:YbaB/EbfC family nucleoid-associated protein [Saccharopolyspora gregorii]|uniref:YbaB/EbfC family DNA-binding protein n=1 Tax=Saccharopolyspora gregorii TaxID=33914 RepID=A0ABP6RPU4_9PSEU|nr:YbaB/EbfC family nucleoid-associated protein [Saccharopolyspora gregorii]
MDAQARIEEAMAQLGRNMPKVRADPQAVLDGRFTGVSSSGGVTVVVDSLGRVEEVRLAPGACSRYGETELASEVVEASTAARRAAEELDFDAERPERPVSGREPLEPVEEEDFSRRSFLESDW